MVVVRNVFQLKFGKAREAVAMAKESLAIQAKIGMDPQRTRLLTDIVGRFYTLVLEITFNSLGDLERERDLMNSDEWRRWYEKFTTLVESGYREVFQVVDVATSTAQSRQEDAYAGLTR